MQTIWPHFLKKEAEIKRLEDKILITLNSNSNIEIQTYSGRILKHRPKFPTFPVNLLYSEKQVIWTDERTPHKNRCC